MLTATIQNLHNFLDRSDTQYVVPTFQRNYAWIKRMWESFWEDVNLYLNSDYSRREHFFGVFVLMPVQVKDMQIQKYLIIDGQQRLITTCLFLAALRDSMPRDSKNTSMFAERINATLFLRTWTFGREQLPTLLLTPSDHEPFENILLEQEAPKKHLLTKAYLYFLQKLSETFHTDYELFQVAEIILEKFQLVTVLLAPEEDPYPIISRINAVGMMTNKYDFELIRKFSPNPKLMSMIAAGESPTQEFKICACRNPYTGKHDNKMRDTITKAVAAFMNSSGGTLLIGIADDGTITGIEDEYALANPSKANWDGYELFLADLLNKSLSVATSFQYFTITRHTLHNHDIAQIQVQPTPAPAYVNNKLYVRAGAQSKELQGPDLVGYVNGRWGEG